MEAMVGAPRILLDVEMVGAPQILLYVVEYPKPSGSVEFLGMVEFQDLLLQLWSGDLPRPPEQQHESFCSEKK